MLDLTSFPISYTTAATLGCSPKLAANLQWLNLSVVLASVSRAFQAEFAAACLIGLLVVGMGALRNCDLQGHSKNDAVLMYYISGTEKYHHSARQDTCRLPVKCRPDGDSTRARSWWCP